MNTTEPRYLSDLLLTEVAAGWTRECVSIAAGDALPIGTVLVKAASGVCAPPVVDPASKEDAYAVLAEPLPASAAARPGVVIARGATLNVNQLIWTDTLPEARRKALIASFDKRGLVLKAAL